MKIDSYPSRLRRLVLPTLLAAAFLAAAAVGAGDCRAEEAAYKTLPVGSAAPGFKATTSDGQPFDLQERLAKKNVALFFWSLFCSPCREEMPYIDKLLKEELQDKPVDIVALNLDEPALHTAVRNFLKSAGYGFTVVMSKTAALDSQSDKLYVVTGTPVLYLIRQDGTISFAHVGRLEPAALKKAIQDNLLTPGM